VRLIRLLPLILLHCSSRLGACADLARRTCVLYRAHLITYFQTESQRFYSLRVSARTSKRVRGSAFLLLSRQGRL
jgi:hypothetical protein